MGMRIEHRAGCTLHFYGCEQCGAEAPAGAYGVVLGETTSAPPSGWTQRDEPLRKGFALRTYYCPTCSEGPR